MIDIDKHILESLLDKGENELVSLQNPIFAIITLNPRINFFFKFPSVTFLLYWSPTSCNFSEKTPNRLIYSQLALKAQFTATGRILLESGTENVQLAIQGSVIDDLFGDGTCQRWVSDIKALRICIIQMQNTKVHYNTRTNEIIDIALQELPANNAS